MEMIKAKICLFGDPAVGKTSLIRRYVYDMFDDKYLTTLGTKVTKKIVKLNWHGRDIDVVMMIWDIVGQREFTNLIKDAYFYGAKGLIGVCDITRKETLENIDFWMGKIKEIVKEDVPLILIANKADLEERQFGENELGEYAKKYNAFRYFITSAKTGENVKRCLLCHGRENSGGDNGLDRQIVTIIAEFHGFLYLFSHIFSRFLERFLYIFAIHYSSGDC